MGGTFEELETRVLRAHFDIYYSRLKDVGGMLIIQIACQCRQLEENNDYYSQKKKLIGLTFQ